MQLLTLSNFAVHFISLPPHNSMGLHTSAEQDGLQAHARGSGCSTHYSCHLTSLQPCSCRTVMYLCAGRTTFSLLSFSLLSLQLMATFGGSCKVGEMLRWKGRHTFHG